MNIENIRAIRNAIAAVGRLDMKTFQGRTSNGFYAKKLADMHTCGNTACIAGYMALTPEFQAGSCMVVSGLGIPGTTDNAGSADAMARFCDIRYDLAYAIINGYDMEDTILPADQITQRLGTFLKTPWHNWKSSHAIKLLDSLINGTFPQDTGLSPELLRYEHR